MRRVIVPRSLSFSRWTQSVAAFALLLLVVTFFLHRLFGMPTVVALNLAKVAYIIAGLALVLALTGGYYIWRTGAEGTSHLTIGVVIAVAILLAPPMILQASSGVPALSDVTTDFAHPPPFQNLAKQRGPGANPVRYQREAFAGLQREYYPDLKPMMVGRPAAETFALVVDALKRENLDIAREVPPGEDGATPGYLEAIDRTLIFGFYDDVAIRVASTGGQTRIDMRSASRYGRHDLGRNATRMRTLMRQVVTRLEETIQANESGGQDADDDVKPDESARQAQAEARRSRARARARTRRARERKVRRRQQPMRVPNYISPMPGY